MPVRRDRPSASNPGELHTKDGRTLRLKLPPELQRDDETTDDKPKPPQRDDGAVDRETPS